MAKGEREVGVAGALADAGAEAAEQEATPAVPIVEARAEEQSRGDHPQRALDVLLVVGRAQRADRIAHVEAPTAASEILAADMLKMGGYGLLRFNLPLYPQGSEDWAPVIIVLSIIGIIYGALVALVQPDLLPHLTEGAFGDGLAVVDLPFGP